MRGGTSTSLNTLCKKWIKVIVPFCRRACEKWIPFLVNLPNSRTRRHACRPTLLLGVFVNRVQIIERVMMDHARRESSSDIPQQTLFCEQDNRYQYSDLLWIDAIRASPSTSLRFGRKVNSVPVVGFVHFQNQACRHYYWQCWFYHATEYSKDGQSLESSNTTSRPRYVHFFSSRTLRMLLHPYGDKSTLRRPRGRW